MVSLRRQPLRMMLRLRLQLARTRGVLVVVCGLMMVRMMFRPATNASPAAVCINGVRCCIPQLEDSCYDRECYPPY